MNPVCERSSSPSFVTRQKQVNQENPRGARRPPCCGNTCFLTPEAKMAFRITYRTYVTGPEANGAEGPCGDEARRSAEEPEAPSEAPKHIRAVMRSASSELNERYPKRARSDYYPSHSFTGGEGSMHSILLQHGCQMNRRTKQQTCAYSSFINAVARMDVDESLSVGDGVTAKGTRADQEEPRSSIALLGADEQPCGRKRYTRPRRRSLSCRHQAPPN